MRCVANSFFKFLLCLLATSLFFSLQGNGQAVQEARYERENKNNDSDFIVISMAEKGVALIRSKDEYKEGNQSWEVTVLDTDLKELWSIDLSIQPRLRLVGYEFKHDWLYLLFRVNDHEASDLRLFTVHTSTKETKQFTIKQELSFKVTHLGVLDKVIVLGGYVSKEPAILIYNLTTENLKVVPGFFVSNTELLDLRMNVNNTFNTLILDQKSKEQKRIILKTFDVTGAILLEESIELDYKRTILSGITSTLANDNLFVTGTWTVGLSRAAAGIYSIVIDPFNKQSINYYTFGQLDHFLDYQSEKKADRIKQKSTDAKIITDVPDFRASTSLTKLEELPNGFALLNEVYQPSASFNSTSYWNDYYNPYYYYGYSPYGYNPFMSRYYNRPYQYNSATAQSGETKIMHASVVLFDLNGKIIKDCGMTLSDKKTDGIEQTSDFLVNNGKVSIAYKKEKKILISQTELNDKVVLDTLEVSPSSPNQLIRHDTEDSFIRHWYGNHMYYWGYQRMKNIGEDTEDLNKNVFYIIKVRID